MEPLLLQKDSWEKLLTGLFSEDLLFPLTNRKLSKIDLFTYYSDHRNFILFSFIFKHFIMKTKKGQLFF